MEGINYYSLLKDGLESLRKADLEEVVKSVVYHRRDLEDPDAAYDAFTCICFEPDEKWAGMRTKIVREASAKHANQSNQSNYCLNALRELAYEASKVAARHDESPELEVVRRQVSDHLRKLNDDKILVSNMVRTRAGKDLFKLWGLEGWGPDWVKKKSERSFEDCKRDLNPIFANRKGKGIFSYLSVLPTYIPNVLDTYGAALSTDEITSTICFKISPPLLTKSDMAYPDGSYDPWDDERGAGYLTVPDPETLLMTRQLLESFRSMLSARELQVYEMSAEGLSVEDIANAIGCVTRTVNSDRKSIEAKKVLCFLRYS